MSVDFYSVYSVMKCLFSEPTKRPKCKISMCRRMRNMRNMRREKRSGDREVPVRLMLKEQISMHMYVSIVGKWFKRLTTVCTEQKYVLFYLFSFIKVCTDFVLESTRPTGFALQKHTETKVIVLNRELGAVHRSSHARTHASTNTPFPSAAH